MWRAEQRHCARPRKRRFVGCKQYNATGIPASNDPSGKVAFQRSQVSFASRTILTDLRFEGVPVTCCYPIIHTLPTLLSSWRRSPSCEQLHRGGAAAVTAAAVCTEPRMSKSPSWKSSASVYSAHILFHEQGTTSVLANACSYFMWLA